MQPLSILETPLLAKRDTMLNRWRTEVFNIVYYDTDEDSATAFRSRHKSNKHLDITICTSMDELFSYIKKEKKIDLILIDFFSKLPKSSESRKSFSLYQSMLSTGESSIQEDAKNNEHMNSSSDTCSTNHCTIEHESKKEAKSNSSQDKQGSQSQGPTIEDLVLDFKKHKDHLNEEINKVWLSEGIYAVDTLTSYFKTINRKKIPIAIHSMLGRRLISSKEASMLENRGVLWVWKSKETLLREQEPNQPRKITNCPADQNSEFDSIFNAITTIKLREAKLEQARNSLWLTLGVQVACYLFLFFYILSNDTSIIQTEKVVTPENINTISTISINFIKQHYTEVSAFLIALATTGYSIYKTFKD